jgi:hypothetical protein
MAIEISSVPDCRHCLCSWHGADVDKIDIYSLQNIATMVPLTRGGMVLIALLSGGDYNPVRLDKLPSLLLLISEHMS